MMQEIPRVLVNLLTVATVVAWSIAPPPILHGQQGGRKLSLNHAKAHNQLACLATVESDANSDGAADLHYHWLGFHLAHTDDSPTQKGGDCCLSKLLSFQISRASLHEDHARCRLDTTPAFLPLKLATAVIAAGRAPDFCSGSCVMSRPLCDRARHERSGVQLS